ncbi:MAG: glycosyltransferase [Legionellaceae bacterium]|nr:glycosyltransferase [Legionellaceae bacterium]
MEKAIIAIGVCILIYFAVLWLGYLIFLVSSFTNIIKKYQESTYSEHIMAFYNHTILPPITIIMPAYNESKRIMNAITAIRNSDYKNIHLIVVNDGSTDKTLQLLIDEFSLKKTSCLSNRVRKTGKVIAYYTSDTIANFIVIDKEHSPYANSAADCINAGLNICQTPLFITIDSDTILEKTALSHMLFMYFTHAHCVAIGGDIYVPDATKISSDGKLSQTNIPPSLLLGVQVCEYLRSFLYGREGWSFLGGSLSFPGAFTLFETQAVQDFGGFDSSNFAYDAEIIMNLHHEMRRRKYPYSVIYAPSAIAWAESPNTLKLFWIQRNHWQRGLLRSLSRHKNMVFNPKYGITGLIAFPYYILFEIFGPVVESIAYITLILTFFFSQISLSLLAWLIFLAWSYITFITMSCVLLSTLTYNKYYTKLDILRILSLTTIDMFFFRQYRAFCALLGTFHYLFNRLRGKPQ